VTFLDLVRSSFRLISVLKEGQGPNPDDIKDALFVCNAMLDAWGARRLLVYAMQILQFTLVPSKQAYTIGPGGDFDTGANVRPQRIERANLILNDVTPVVRRPVSVLTFQQWSEISVQQISSSIPLALYLDEAFPLGNLSTYPDPSLPYGLELYVWGQLAQIADETTVINLPPAYADAIRYNLALRLSLEWDRPLKPGVELLARQSLAVIESINAPQLQLRNDFATLSRRDNRSGWNYLSRTFE
jgi:hypothetical protein